MITVRVPATAANLGAGFDSMALALELFNSVELEPIEGGVQIEIEGEGADHLPRDAGNLIARAALRMLRALGREEMGLRIHAHNQIPVGSGLGSSSAAALAGTLGARALADGALSDESLLGIIADLEGHADNAAAALHGGLTLVAPEAARERTPSRPCGPPRYVTATVPLPPTTVAVAIPRQALTTEEMRRTLPRNVPLAYASYGIGHALLTAEALRTGDYALLARAVDDRLHQPHREPLIAGALEARRAAREAGAAAVALAGAGPALIAFAPTGHTAIAEAMTAAFPAGARGFVLSIDQAGARLST